MPETFTFRYALDVFNIGGGELLVIFLVVVIFVGPSKLPEVANILGRATTTIRRFNQSFQDEIQSSFDDPIEAAARERGHAITNAEHNKTKNAPPDALDKETDVEKEQ